MDLFDEAVGIACRGPFLVAKQILPAMRRRGSGTFLFSNNQYSLRGGRDTRASPSTTQGR